MKHLALTISLFFLFSPLIASADTGTKNTTKYVQVNRYTVVDVDTTIQQKNPLKTVVSITIPNSVKTIAQALNYVLLDTSYQLLSSAQTQKEVRNIYIRNLPTIHRSFNHISVENILKTLMGSPFVLLVDPVSREISFTVSE